MFIIVIFKTFRYQTLFSPVRQQKKKDGQAGWHAKKEQGMKQVREYLELDELQRLPKLRSYLLLTDGHKLEAIAVTRRE